MQTAGVIEPSRARHNTPLLAIKKANGKLRICADLRALNRVCEDFEWEFPRLDVALSKMTTATIFSKIDLTSGFWQLPLSEKSRDCTTFRFDGNTWRFAVVPFGWKGAPAAFQSTMDMVLQQGINKGFLSVYMDDILVHSRNLSEHVENLDWTLRTLTRAGFKLNPDKCVFGVSEIEFLGHIVSSAGIKPKPDKLDIIQNLGKPRNVRELRSLLGTIGFYQSFIPGYASLIRPMSKLLSAKEPFLWGDPQNDALTRIKGAFTAVNPLAYIDPLNSKEFVLITDASASALGAQLLRVNHDGQRFVVTNVSRALLSAETRYSNTERELLAIVWALERLEIIIAGRVVTVRTDHAALLPILTGSVKKVSTPRVERLRLKLGRFVQTGLFIGHTPGKSNMADALSRPLAHQKPSARLQERALPTAPGTRPRQGGEDRAEPARMAPLAAKPKNRTSEEKLSSQAEPATRPKRGRPKKQTASQPNRPATASPSASYEDSSVVLSALESDEGTETPPSRETSPEPETQEPDHWRTLAVLRHSEVQAAQRKDAEIKKIVSWLSRREGPEPVPGARELVIVNNVLFSPRNDLRTSHRILRYYMPTALRIRAIETAHTAAHVGYDVTVQSLENLAYWPSFRKDTKAYISKCLVCKEKATSYTETPLGDAPTPPHPWHTVGMDLLQLPVTKRGNKYLLVLIDILTRYATAIPLMDKSASQVVSALKRYVFNDGLLGPPAVILTDNGLEFCNAAVTRLLKRHGTRHAYTTPYNPKGNGATERLNRTLLSLLRGILTPGLEWDRHVQTVLNIYNHCPIRPQRYRLMRPSQGDQPPSSAAT